MTIQHDGYQACLGGSLALDHAYYEPIQTADMLRHEDIDGPRCVKQLTIYKNAMGPSSDVESHEGIEP